MTEDLLSPYTLGLESIHPALIQLQKLLEDNPQQAGRAVTLINGINDLLSFWKNLEGGISNVNGTPQRISEITSQEKEKMDKLRAQLSEMTKVENQLLIDREKNSQGAVQLAKWGLILGILLILCTVSLLIRQIFREFMNRQKAEDDLRKNYGELSNVNLENAERNWLLDGLAKVNDVLQSQLDLPSLTNELLLTIVKYANVQAGAFYVYNEDQNKLLLLASSALPASAKKEYALNEGLVGQAATERNPVIISDIPKNYMTIEGGIATIEPVHAIFSSFFHDGKLKGVIELLSFQPVHRQFLELLKLLRNNIAVTVQSVMEREKVLHLLEQVQRQKEVLEHQQEELRQTNEELTVQAEVLQASEEELRVQEEELRQVNAELKEKNRAIEETKLSLIGKAKELEESSKYKSEFLANMSHELRTPLNSVLILAKLLSENRDGNLTEKQVAHAKIINRSGSDLLQLINDILDLSRIEAGKVNLYVENVSVKAMATDLEQLFAAVAEEKRIKYDVEFIDEVPEKIKTDEQKVGQIINLLSNAFKFTPENGRVSLQFKKVRSEARDYLSISVKDTGIGIAKEKQQVIFQAFQQADGSTNRKFGGTGLGLSITKELIRLLKGKIHIESKENAGSTFTILIPFDHESMEDNAITANPGANNNTSTDEFIEIVAEQNLVSDDRLLVVKDDKVMLIIEDDTDFAIIIREFAKSNGYKAVIALTGDEGWFCARKISSLLQLSSI